MTLKIISAEQIIYEGDVTSVTLPGEMGRFTVLNNHASLLSVLVKGEITFVSPDSTEHSESIAGGIADVDDNVISVCVF